MTATKQESSWEISGEFLSDVTTLRERARRIMDKGPMTDAHGADLPRVLDVLNLALAMELTCVLRYKRHFFAAECRNAQVAAGEFLEHAVEVSEHAEEIAARILQLGGEPDLNPDTLTGASHYKYDSSIELESMIREDLVAERAAISACTEIVDWLGDGDPASRRVLEEIVSTQEEHAEDMLDLLSGTIF